MECKSPFVAESERQLDLRLYDGFFILFSSFRATVVRYRFFAFLPRRLSFFLDNGTSIGYSIINAVALR